MKNSLVAIILARGNSKGVKYKNMIKVNNKPLIYWTIRDCLKSKNINSVWVSSDNSNILSYAKKIGARTIIRPKKYAKDNSTSDSAWLHSIKFLEKTKVKFKNVIGLQPTSPIRGKKDIDKAFNLFNKKKFDSLFSAQIIQDHFIWKKSKNKLIANYNFKFRPARQQIEKKFLENGSFYIFNKKKFLRYKNRLFGRIGVYVMSKINSFQIDNKEDIKIVDSLKTHLK